MPIRSPLGKHSPHQKSLHPSRRMAWKKLRHGVAVNFLSPRKKNTAVLDKQVRSNKILQNKQKYFRFYFVITK